MAGHYSSARCVLLSVGLFVACRQGIPQAAPAASPRCELTADLRDDGKVVVALQGEPECRIVMREVGVEVAVVDVVVVEDRTQDLPYNVAGLRHGRITDPIRRSDAQHRIARLRRLRDRERPVARPAVMTSLALPAMTIATGTVLSERWELTTRLASGGMGDVYRAQDRRGGQDVAIKVLRSGIMQGEERFAGEIEMLRRLDHPHVVAVVDAGDHDGVPYLVMELLPGRTLSDLLRDGALDLDRVRRIGAAIAAALAYAHGHGIINRDLKPGNILFDEAGSAKLADFGIAKLMDVSGITITGQALGTASYIAPEQLSAPERVGPATDVYSLGLVLLEAASGQRAFVGSGTEAAMARLARDPAMPTDLPETWQRLLRAMTARDPDLRPPAVEVADLLERELPEEAVQTLVVPPARDDDATVPMAMPVADGAPAAPGRDETKVMGEQTHAMAAGSAAAAPAAAADPTTSNATPTSAPRPPRSSPAPRRRSNATPWILVILLLLVIAGGAVFLVLGGGDDPADETEPDVPAETEDPPDGTPPDEPEDTDPDAPADGDEPTEEPEPDPDPEPEPGDPADEPAPPADEPGGGPPEDTPGDPQGPPGDDAGEGDGSQGVLPIDPGDELGDLDVEL